jgi:hypothetical protein
MGFNMNKPPKNLIDNALLREVASALKELEGWGSVEVFVQNGKVTQITKKAIKKTDHKLEFPLDRGR